jgi:hypothetical protein
VYRTVMTTATQRITRIAASLLGLAAAIAALMPVLALIDEAKFSATYPQYHVGLWSKVGIGATVAIAVALCVSISYLILRHAIVGSSSQAGTKSAAVPFFASAAVASAAVVMLAALSQAVLLGVAAIRLSRVSTNDVSVHWSPQMWQTMRDAPASLAAALAVFVLTFFWQYRRSTRF